MGAVLEFAMQLETLTCGKCGIEFAVPLWWLKEKRENGGSFTCPNGDGRVFKESEVDRLKREVEAQKKKIEEKERSLKYERERADSNFRAMRQAKGKLDAVKKRVGNGTCPCCHRTFKQLAAHMANKHPDYQQPEPEVGSNG